MKNLIALAVALVFCQQMCHASSLRSRSSNIETARIFNSGGLMVEKDVNSEGTGCRCVGYDCGCCLHMDVPKVDLNDTICVNITYLPEQYGVSLTMSIDNSVFYNKTVSLKNPPPVCEYIPGLKKLASTCAVFYNLSLNRTQFSGCMYVDIRLDNVVLKKFDIGCFHIPLKNINNHLVLDSGAELDMKDPLVLQKLSPHYSDGGCGCKHPYYDCGCCVHVEIDLLKFDHSACGNVTFNPSTEELSAILTVDGNVFVNESVSVRNPPPICIPFLGVKGVEICIQFYNLDISGGKFTGCLRVLTEVEGRVHTYDVGCFAIPPLQSPMMVDMLGEDAELMTFKEIGKEKFLEQL